MNDAAAPMVATQLPRAVSAQTRLLLPFFFERRAAERAAGALANASAGLAGGLSTREPPRKLYRYRLEMTGHLDRFLFSHGEKGAVEGSYLHASGDRAPWLAAPWPDGSTPSGAPEENHASAVPLGDRLGRPGARFSMAELIAALLEPLRGLGLSPIQESLGAYSVVALPHGVEVGSDAARPWNGPFLAVQAARRDISPAASPSPGAFASCSRSAERPSAPPAIEVRASTRRRERSVSGAPCGAGRAKCSSNAERPSTESSAALGWPDPEDGVRCARSPP